MTKDEQKAAIALLPPLEGMVDGSGDFMLLLATGQRVWFTRVGAVARDGNQELWLTLELYDKELRGHSDHEFFGFDDDIPGILPVQVRHIVALVDRNNGADLAEEEDEDESPCGGKDQG